MGRISSEKSVQMLVYLLKRHKVRKIVASPGTTNLNLVLTLQNEGGFEVYSCPDERSAAYLAVGMAQECDEPVVITCTGATASREYMAGLTEAFYRKLPIIAVTASQPFALAGHLSPQFIDRSAHPVDVVRLSVRIPAVRNEEDEWDCNIKLNQAILETKRRGGGPVHIDLETTYANDFVEMDIPSWRVIKRYAAGDSLPPLSVGEKIAISVGGHRRMSRALVEAIEKFCEENNAAVFCDHSSSYHGKYKILPTIATCQEFYEDKRFIPDLLIHIGEQHGDYYTAGKLGKARKVWRVSEDGEIRDTFRKLTKVFEMSEEHFFRAYVKGNGETNVDYYRSLRSEIKRLYKLVPRLPYSNVWIAKRMAAVLPDYSALILGCSNTQRAWTFFELPDPVESKANVGCRGIDGTVSSLIGASLSNPQKLYFGVVGDLTFFYDMNVLGNRHVGNNVRILLVNNGGGAEFHIYHHRAQSIQPEDVGTCVAADGHYGNKSRHLIRHYAEDLGFRYMSASSKEEFLDRLDEFASPEMSNRPIFLEAFTDFKDESEAVRAMRNLLVDRELQAKQKVRDIAKKTLGDKGYAMMRNWKRRLTHD